MKMNCVGYQSVALLLLAGFLRFTAGQTYAETCLAKFENGKDNFVLDTDESVNEGATVIASPKVDNYRDCVISCCKRPGCNVALMERGDEGTIKSCFLFDCLYKMKFACRFVKKAGYFNYVLESVYEEYLKMDVTSEKSDSPPVADAGHDLVVQPKESVTLNGVQSRDDVKIESFTWQMLTSYPYAFIEKTSFPDQIIVSNLTSGQYKFKLTVTDDIGQSDTATVNVLVLTPEESEHHCMVPKKSGPCRGMFYRWHYNAASGKCERFVFGGCLPNKNNYVGEKECIDACSGTGGPSTRGLPVTSSHEKCEAPCTDEQFSCENGCCLDKGLECDETPQCSDGSDEKKCAHLKEKFRILMSIPVDEQKARCTHQPETGTCRNSDSKWYYDAIIQKCGRFNYGGCGGNDNRFDSEENCLKICRGVTDKDVFERSGKAEKQESDRNTSILVIAVLLGVAIIVVLGILGYCFIKKRNAPKHSQVTYNNTTAGMRESDHMVYKSTTKPM